MFQTQCDVLNGGGLCGMRSGIVTERCVGKSALQQECPQCDPVFLTGCLCEGRPVAGVLRLPDKNTCSGKKRRVYFNGHLGHSV